MVAKILERVKRVIVAPQHLPVQLNTSRKWNALRFVTRGDSRHLLRIKYHFQADADRVYGSPTAQRQQGCNLMQLILNIPRTGIRNTQQLMGFEIKEVHSIR
ncbi:MAG: hypothetical protein QM578_18615 [Pantoea sp.]